MNASQAARKWGISRQRAIVLIRSGRVQGATPCASCGGWQIPDDAPKPATGAPGRPKRAVSAPI